MNENSVYFQKVGNLPNLQRRANVDSMEKMGNLIKGRFFDVRGSAVNGFSQVDAVSAMINGIDRNRVEGSRSLYPVDWNYCLDNFGKKPMNVGGLNN